MHPAPKFTYFLAHDLPVLKDSELWMAPVPLDRNAFQPQSRRIPKFAVRYGDYFTLARDFLKKNEFEILKRGLKSRFKRDIASKDIQEIHIHLEKHGPLYHPARVVAYVHGEKHALVLNVAISEAGKSCLLREYETIEKLNKIFPLGFLPDVYGFGEAATQDRLNASMFLGGWFEGYNEFHITQDTSSGFKKLAVWDPRRGRVPLSKAQEIEIYRKAALILTCYFNIETCEQIFPWYHAAGDFVVGQSDGRLDVRLITARRYMPLTEGAAESPESILQALLLFFLDLSIRMRQDRLDGVGDLVWTAETAAEGALNGFFQGLAQKPSMPALFPDPLVECFWDYLSSWPEIYLFDFSEILMELYHPASPEVLLIKQNMKDHIHFIYRTIHI
ncbi:hypothetical protein ACFL9U_09965 [Thermodesulfobacteriota bacterium]